MNSEQDLINELKLVQVAYGDRDEGLVSLTLQRLLFWAADASYVQVGLPELDVPKVVLTKEDVEALCGATHDWFDVVEHLVRNYDWETKSLKPRTVYWQPVSVSKWWPRNWVYRDLDRAKVEHPELQTWGSYTKEQIQNPVLLDSPWTAPDRLIRTGDWITVVERIDGIQDKSFQGDVMEVQSVDRNLIHVRTHTTAFGIWTCARSRIVNTDQYQVRPLSPQFVLSVLKHLNAGD